MWKCGKLGKKIKRKIQNQTAIMKMLHVIGCAIISLISGLLEQSCQQVIRVKKKKVKM